MVNVFKLSRWHLIGVIFLLHDWIQYFFFDISTQVFFFTGIGSIPNAVLSKLGHHRDLGVHTEMFSDGIIDLVHTGVITNAKKTVQTGKIVGSFAFGTRRLYDFMNNNPFVGKVL